MTREQYLAQRSQLMAQAKSFLEAGNIEQFNAAKQKVEELDNKYEAEAAAQANFAALQNSAVVPAALQNLGAGAPAAPVGEGSNNTAADIFDSEEYHTAFMNYACRHVPIPAKFRNAAEVTTSADAGAAIPTTLVKEIIRNLKEYGVVFQQMRHLNIPGGVEIPVVDLKPTATWVGDGASEDKKITTNDDAVSFKYYGLECKIAQSILASIVTVEEFQEVFVELATEAVIAAIEAGAFNGDGNGKMLGVCNDPRVTNVVELTDEEFHKWDSWKKKVFSRIKRAYRRGKFYMTQGTFEGHIDGMVDQVGQPIGRTNYGIGADPEYRFGGKTVDTVEDDVLTPYDAAADGEVVAVYMNMKDYIFNSNMVMTVVHWIDHDTNKKKTKVMLVCDGKIADADGVILVKKSAAAGAAAAEEPEA